MIEERVQAHMVLRKELGRGVGGLLAKSWHLISLARFDVVVSVCRQGRAVKVQQALLCLRTENAHNGHAPISWHPWYDVLALVRVGGLGDSRTTSRLGV